MFEKSLYDLIKGLRQHKGNEKDFIEHSLRECRREIKGSDMDLKATALLKLIYLEMFGHDMSWASFNILEVMSAARNHQKRIGYLGAAQTFGPNTDVLMLATNLLKKDITSSAIPVISLPLVTIPHLATTGLANAVVPDLLARMSHSSPNVRKKSIVTVYRLALVWPEALRPAWPKMKEILENDDEDPGVIASVVNVVCELVWRRPEDFLPLAPRFFELLLNGGNNWMAIKLIKLFATLTPLEPRLIRKLAPALTNLINTTPAMSVLYECINGIIQGGILDGVQDIREGDEIAELCVGKLCGMIAVDGDPNLRYVALLAFNRIVVTHPQLVSAQQDVIATCLDDSDISIRMQALTLVSGMVDSESIVPIVEKLLKHLQAGKIHQKHTRKEGSADSRIDGSSVSRGHYREYGISVVQRILSMCSKDMYSNIADFDWYLDALIQLVQAAPATTVSEAMQGSDGAAIFDRIGSEIRNVAVRVKSARPHAVEAADMLLSKSGQLDLLGVSGYAVWNTLGYAAFIAGEYPSLLTDPQSMLSTLLHQLQQTPPPGSLVAFLQSAAKLLAHVLSTHLNAWNSERHSMTALLLARIASAVEVHTSHRNLEVQEHATTLLEVARISEAALSKHAADELTAPTLIRDVVPSLFQGHELNPIANIAQSKVPMPAQIDLDEHINSDLTNILLRSNEEENDNISPVATDFYLDSEIDLYNRIAYASGDEGDALPNMRPATESKPHRGSDGSSLSLGRETNDPFYINSSTQNPWRASNEMHEIIKDSNGQSLDVDSIPIIKLELGEARTSRVEANDRRWLHKRKKSKQGIFKAPADIAVDETFEGSGDAGTIPQLDSTKNGRRSKAAKALLQVDSSNLGSLSSSPGTESRLQYAPEEMSVGAGSIGNHDAEMKAALAEVERLRLEMQRAQDRVAVSDDIPQEGTLVIKKKKKKKKNKKDRVYETGNKGEGSTSLDVRRQHSSVDDPDEETMNLDIG